MAAALGAAAWKLFDDRHDFVGTFERIGAVPVVASVACGLVGVGATYPMWRETLKGLGVTLPVRDGARVYFVTQIGKYLPGSVWPAVMQMEAGRRRGATRAKMLWANLATILISCAVGLSVAAVLLPVYDRHALNHYWWGLLALPLLMASLHPRVLPWILDRALQVLHRPPTGERLTLRCELRAAGWSLLSWAGLGAQVAVLVVASGSPGFGPVALSVGAMGLAVPLGILFIPAPAGAGIRDVVLLLVLAAVMDSGRAVAVVVGSRAILVLCDVLLAAAAGLAGAGRRERRSGAGERTRTSTPLGTRT